MRRFICSFLLIGFIVELAAFHAQAEWSLQAGRSLRYENASNGYSVHAETPWNLRAGYILEHWTFLAEHAWWRGEADGNSTLSVRSAQTSDMVWVRRSIFSETAFGPFVGLGLGVYQDEVETSIYGSHRRDFGEVTSQLGGEVGWWMNIVGPLTVEADVGVNMSPQFSPLVMWNFAVRIGIVF